MGVGVLGVSKGLEAGVNKVMGNGENNMAQANPSGEAVAKLIKYNPSAGYSDEDFALN